MKETNKSCGCTGGCHCTSEQSCGYDNKKSASSNHENHEKKHSHEKSSKSDSHKNKEFEKSKLK